MMKAAFDIVKEYPHKEIEASMERYMKCGVGICGICSMDGMRTCVDGTIFKKDFLERSKFFGKLHRKKTGELEEI
jgi:dihydroorotate dehydrogenase electron transfer subunit